MSPLFYIYQKATLLPYICAMHFINYNGKIFLADTPIIGAESRGLRYGDGIFETLKLKNGQLILEELHFARLWKGLETLQFTIPKLFNSNKLREEIIALALKNKYKNTVRIRINIFRSNGGLYDSIDNYPNYIIETWPLPEENGELNNNGLDVGIYNEAKKSCDILSNLKHNNYLPYVLAAITAKKNKWNDAIILNSNNNICDSTIANVFIIKNELIYTPPLADGCVAGVMRNHFLMQLPLLGFNCIEQTISQEQLNTADEVFLTNAIYIMRWVKSIGKSKYKNNLVQKIYTAMLPTIK